MLLSCGWVATARQFDFRVAGKNNMGVSDFGQLRMTLWDCFQNRVADLQLAG
jgi:hypothetical protein